ncbi:MAG: M18 family aminopeptidase [Acidimicrobiales bacterium]
MPTELDAARALCRFIEASPSPFHAAARAAQRLEEAGFKPVDEREPLPAGGRHLLVRGGALVAWSAPERLAPSFSFRLVGAHTDSPNLRIKPNPDTGRAGVRQLGVEVYGGALLNSWLDRDLGLSGRVAVAGEAAGGPPELVALLVDRPVLRVPQLAIHLDREVNDKGLVLNRQQHLAPLWALGAPEEDGFARFLAGELGVAVERVLAWDVMCHDLTPPALLGRDEEFLAAPRIDNLLSCWAGAEALAQQSAEPDETVVHALALFDHEEVGSASERGAAGGFLGSVLERIAAAGAGREGYLAALGASLCVSADCAHATHPNYADRHEPEHTVALNGGPVVKVNANLRYASDAATIGAFVDACRRADVPMQRFVTRSDLACGSTIGPLTAAQLGMPTVDVGAPQLSMHSARELCGSADPALLVRALRSFLA